MKAGDITKAMEAEGASRDEVKRRSASSLMAASWCTLTLAAASSRFRTSKVLPIRSSSPAMQKVPGSLSRLSAEARQDDPLARDYRSLAEPGETGRFIQKGAGLHRCRLARGRCRQALL